MVGISWYKLDSVKSIKLVGTELHIYLKTNYMKY